MFSALYQNHPKRCNVGDTLRALIFDEEGNEINPADVDAEIQWFADGVEITDETDAEYTVLVGDEGVVLSVEVTIGDETYTAETEKVEAAEVEELTVKIDNTTPTVGDTLTATVVDRNGEDVSDNVTFQWYADDVAIEGADEDTLVVDDELLGAVLKVVVTAENGNVFESEETAEVESEEEALYTVFIDNTTPKVGDTLTVTVEDADGEEVDLTDADIQWFAGEDEIEDATDAELEVTDEMVGEIISVIVTIDDVEYTAETSEVYDSLALLSADQTGKNVVTLTTNGPVTALDDIDVLKGTKEVEIDKIDYEDDGAKVTLKNSIVADAEYTVVLTPADEDDEATSATFVGQRAQLTEIRFLNKVLVLADNKYKKGYAYVKGYDQFDGEVPLSGLTVNAGLGDMTAYDPETGKLTLEATQDNAYMLVKEVPVFVQVQVGNSVVSGHETLEVSTRAFVDNLEFGDIEKDGTKRDDERLTITELSSGKYYVELNNVADQYGNPLSADDLNDQVEDNVLFVIPNTTGAFYATGKFGTINGTTVLWLQAPKDGAKPGTMTLTITGAGGKTFTQEITVEDDPYIDTMTIGYPELYDGAGKSNPIEFSAVDQYGEEIDLWQFKPYVNADGDLVFTDRNHMTNTSTTMKVSNAEFNVVTDNTAKKEFEVTLKTTGTAKSMAVFTTTTSGTKVYTGSVTIGEIGTALQIKDTFGSSTQLERSTTELSDLTDPMSGLVGKGSSSTLNVNDKIAFEDVNGNTMVRGKDDLYPYFTNEDLAIGATPANTKASAYKKFAWVLTDKKIPDVTANNTITGLVSGIKIDEDGQIKDTEIQGKADYYVTLFGCTDNDTISSAGRWYKLDQRSIHVTEVVGHDNNAKYSITAPGTLYIDKNSKHSVKVGVKATTDSGETYSVASDRISLTLDDRFTVSNNEVKGAIGDNWTGDKTGSVEATVWVTSSDSTKVEAGTVTINYTDAAPVATKAELKYKSATKGDFKTSRVGEEVSGDVTDIELGNLATLTPKATIEDGVLTLENGNSVGDTITAQIKDQYGVVMQNTTFYLDGKEITNASVIDGTPKTVNSRGAIEYRSGDVTNKFYFTADSQDLGFTVTKKASETVTTKAAFEQAFAEAAADNKVNHTITLGEKADGTDWTVADAKGTAIAKIPANITIEVPSRVKAVFGATKLTVDGALVIDGVATTKAVDVGTDATTEGKLTVNGSATIGGALKVWDKSEVVNNGAIIVDADGNGTSEAGDTITVDGKFTNSKTVTAYSVSGTGTYTNKAGATTTAIDEIGMTADTTLENYGKVIAATISGYVKLGDGSTTIATASYNTTRTTVEAGATATIADKETGATKTLEITAGTEPFKAAMTDIATASVVPESGAATVSENGGTATEIKTPSATVSAVTVSGTSGSAITATDLTLSLTNEKFEAATAGAVVTSWFTNIPAGLVATIKSDVAANGTTAVITISGTPTDGSTEVMKIKIPAASVSGTQDVTVTANSSAKYAITGATAEEKAEALEKAKATAIKAIGEANTAYTGLDGTKSKWDAYVEADTAADTAISDYKTAGGTANAENLTNAYTTFTANAEKPVTTVYSIALATTTGEVLGTTGTFDVATTAGTITATYINGTTGTVDDAVWSIGTAFSTLSNGAISGGTLTWTGADTADSAVLVATKGGKTAEFTLTVKASN